MDVRVGVAPATATAEMGDALVASILAIPVVLARLLPSVAAPTRIPSMGRSSLTAIPNPIFIGGATLANAA